MLKVIPFAEYDNTKHMLPMAHKDLKAGERVQGATKGVVQHDCAKNQPVIILFEDGHSRYTRLWVNG